jgi:hypothetical protein
MLRSCPMRLNGTRLYSGSSWSTTQFGSEAAGREQATGEVVGEVAKPEAEPHWCSSRPLRISVGLLEVPASGSRPALRRLACSRSDRAW